MDTLNQTEALLHALREARTKDIERQIRQVAARAEHEAKRDEARKQRQRDFMHAIGTDLGKLDSAAKHDDSAQEEELKAFTDQFRPQYLDRHSKRAAEVRSAALRSQVLSESGHTVLPAFASSIFTTDLKAYTGTGTLQPFDGEINNGWVFPDDPTNIKIKDTRHYPNALCWDNRQTPFPEFLVDFTFVPATTATYEMTAILAFHGFYVLRVDDSWWNCRAASVKLTTQMNVHQYSDYGWQDTTLIDIEKQNTNEVTSYDRTQFFSYTAALRAGDPVVVTVKGSVQASAHGAGAYAELNFYDGVANYIQPLFVSVIQV